MIRQNEETTKNGSAAEAANRLALNRLGPAEKLAGADSR